jgi:hypothetical protein
MEEPITNKFLTYLGFMSSKAQPFIGGSSSSRVPKLPTYFRFQHAITPSGLDESTR